MYRGRRGKDRKEEDGGSSGRVVRRLKTCSTYDILVHFSLRGRLGVTTLRLVMIHSLQCQAAARVISCQSQTRAAAAPGRPANSVPRFEHSRACISTSVLPRHRPDAGRLAHDNDVELQISPRNSAYNMTSWRFRALLKTCRAIGRACSTQKTIVVQGFL